MILQTNFFLIPVPNLDVSFNIWVGVDFGLFLQSRFNAGSTASSKCRCIILNRLKKGFKRLVLPYSLELWATAVESVLRF